MSEQFYTILTKIGRAKIANSGVLGTKVNFVKFKVGDGGGSYYSPTEDQIDVKNKVWEGNISAISVDESNPNWIVIETVIPTSDGGFTIREAGIFDDENNLIAIGKYPETYKPVAAEGSSKDLLIRMILEVSNAENVNLKVDPMVILATKKDIQTLESKIQVINTQLSDLANDRIYYSGTTSGTNTYTVSNSEITAYTEGLTVRIKIGTASTGASTLNINGLGAKTILDSLGNAITSGGLKAGLPYQLCYNGTNFIVLGKGGGGDADPTQVLFGKKFTNDSGQQSGTMPNRAGDTACIASSVSGTTLKLKASEGYRDGVKDNVTITDADFISANIVSGKNIFGVAGSVIVPNTPPNAKIITGSYVLLKSNGEYNSPSSGGTWAGSYYFHSILPITYPLYFFAYDATKSGTTCYISGRGISGVLSCTRSVLSDGTVRYSNLSQTEEPNGISAQNGGHVLVKYNIFNDNDVMQYTIIDY